MRRGGILAFIIYLILGAGAIITPLCITSSPPEFNSLGDVLSTIIFLGFVASVFIPMLVVKTLHMITGWKLFSIICVIGNIVLIGAFVFNLFSSGIEANFDNILNNIIATLIIIAPSTIALISEIVGLKRS